MTRDDDQGACVHCGNTGIYVETRFKDDEILRDRDGQVLRLWEIRAVSPEERRRKVASGEWTVQPVAIAYQVADPNRFCECEAGRDREHQALANTPVLHKRTRTTKNREGERDAS